MKKTPPLSGRLLLGAIAGAVAFVALCLAVFGVPLTAAMLGLSALLLARRSRLCVAAPLLLLAWKLPLLEYADRVETLAETPHWSPRDRLGVWLLNLGMAGAGAALGLPEVAAETALLALPGPRRRSAQSDFAMGSPAVRRALNRQVAHLPARPDHRRDLVPQTVVFGGDPLRESARVALALNPATLTGWAEPTPQGWRLHLTARVAVDYPPDARLHLLTVNRRPIVIDEGLFTRLQRAGWLHPFTMAWTWTMAADDARLADAETVGRGWAEALWVEALQRAARQETRSEP